MAKRISVALATVLVSMFVAFPVLGQPAKDAVAPAKADLAERIKEVQNNPRQFEAAYKTGSKVVAVCANCHGQGGNSIKPDIPNLAGQNPAYLLEQMRQFTTGERRNEFMQGLIKVLKPEEKIGMVVYVANQEVVHKPADNTVLASKGQAYYAKNCVSCHGEQGRGNEKMARIAGQQTNYLNLALKRYRDGSTARRDPLMAASTQQMSNTDIAAVVAYVASMK
ncbi:MAG: c-type cytochrome [Pseudomonadota bacterium]|nr:c-type cytochrome [Pseudomonadota bacterium]